MSSAIQRFPDSSAIRGICVFAALLALMLQGSNAGHMLLVEHSRCAEHGELVHGSAGDHHEAEARGPAETATLQGTAEQLEDAHDHCSISIDRRDAPASIAGADSCIRASTVTTELAPLGQPFANGKARFRLAPKTSPPA